MLTFLSRTHFHSLLSNITHFFYKEKFLSRLQKTKNYFLRLFHSQSLFYHSHFENPNKLRNIALFQNNKAFHKKGVFIQKSERKTKWERSNRDKRRISQRLFHSLEFARLRIDYFGSSSNIYLIFMPLLFYMS